ncbi:response regulator [Psychrosphaera aestuarii]|uniref:response regulator n=1 Tax=Psychrosphaera aestuarii TaxID=1266052 RepID=UPI001B331780|nr:response regulator [Psychrosphaera aestuarii]
MDELKDQYLSALVVEQQSLAQSHIKYSLQHLGFDRIDFVDRAHLAIEALQKRQYQLILCAYELNKGSDGYQLFERFTKQGLMHISTTFIFMSSENDMSLSQSIIELEPDDFLLKPFTSKQLESRIQRALIKKLTFKPVFECLEKQNISGALEHIDQFISANTHPNWTPFLIRLKGNILKQEKDWQKAEAFYQSVLKIRYFSWAQLGLVECYMHLNRLPEAKHLLDELVDNPSTKLQALDLLAFLCEKDKDWENALSYIKDASLLSPRNIERQKYLIDLARITQDFESQYLASNNIIRHLRYSMYEAPGLYLNAIRANIDYGLTTFNETEVSRLAQQSQHILDNLKRKFPKTPLNEQIDIATARIHFLKNESEKAKHLIKMKIDDNREFVVDDLEDALDFAKALHELGFYRDSEKVFSEIVKESASLTNPLFSLFINAEKQLREDVKSSPKELNNNAVGFYTRGKLNEALKAFKTAFRVMPKSPAIALNLLQTIAESQFLDLSSSDVQTLIEQCKNTINSANLNDEQTLRYNKIKASLTEERV